MKLESLYERLPMGVWMKFSRKGEVIITRDIPGYLSIISYLGDSVTKVEGNTMIRVFPGGNVLIKHVNPV